MARGQSRNGFSLLEAIGVIAILVILASLLVPRIFKSGTVSQTMGAVNQARGNDIALALGTVKTAVAQHCARFGSLASSNGVALPVSIGCDRFDSVLIAEQLLERPFAVKAGTGAQLRLLRVSGSASSPSAAYDLQGRGVNSLTGSSSVVEAVISGLTAQEAKVLNDQLDGAALGASPGGDDTRGRVVYGLDARGTPGPVRIYIAHQ